MLNALAVLSSKSGVSSERSKFMELVEREVNRIQDDLSQRGGASLRFTSKGLEVCCAFRHSGAGAPLCSGLFP